MAGPHRMSLTVVAERIERAARPPGMNTRVVAIDGRGGAGKTTLAARLATTLRGAPIVHTDDFANWHQPLNWWPRLLEQVLHPLANGRPSRYQRYDWVHRRLAEWVEVGPTPHLVLEGVSANRTEFRPHLAFAIWVETPRATCLARGLERDGKEMQQQWREWIEAEDGYVERDRPDLHADLAICGDSRNASLGGEEIVVLRDGEIAGGTT